MSKYYNLKNFNPDKKFHFTLVSKIEKIDNILYDSYERDCGIGKENYNYIMRFIKNQQKEIEDLKAMKPLQELIDTNVIIADYSHNYISKDKIREKIKELENKNEENKIELAKGIDMLSSNIIEKAKNNILINMSLRDILKELLEEE